MRQRVAARLLEIGKAKKIAGGEADILSVLCEKKTPEEVAKMLGVTRQAVTQAVKRLGVAISKRGRPCVVEVRAKALGFASAEDYFRACGTKTFEAMSKELKVSTGTTQRYYQMFVEKVQAASA